MPTYSLRQTKKHPTLPAHTKRAVPPGVKDDKRQKLVRAFLKRHQQHG